MKIALVTTILMASVSAGTATPLSAATRSTDEADVIRAVTSMFIALTNDDFARFHSVAGPDFNAFDNGQRFVGDELVQLVKRLHSAGTVYEWHVIEPAVHVHGRTAWITYVNRGSIRNSAENKNMTWLESAVLRKENGVWRIRFFHSSRAP